MATLDVLGAAHANASGIPLFLAACVAIPVAVRGFVRGDSVTETLRVLQFDKVVVLLALGCAVVWIIRAADHFFG